MRTRVALTLIALVAVGCTGFPFPEPTPTSTPTPIPTATPNRQATETVRAQPTHTAQALATAAQARVVATAQAEATTRARATADAIVQATQTAQAHLAAINALAQTARRAHYERRGRMEAPPPYLATQRSNVSLRNMVIRIKFLSSGENWEYSIGFRDGGPYSQYRILVRSSGIWGLVVPTEGLADAVRIRVVASGPFVGADVSPTGSNHIRLVVNDKLAYLFVNGAYVAEMDVSERNTSGLIWIGSVYAVDYEDFEIAALP